MKKSTQSIILVICLVLSLISVQTNTYQADAASKPKLSKSKVTFDDVGDFKTITIKNVNKKNVKVTTISCDNKDVASFFKKSKTSFMVTSDQPGTAHMTVKLSLKKAINKKKTYKFKLTVVVKGEQPLETMTPDPSAAATATPTPSATAGPADPLSAEEKTVYDKIIALKSKYPQGMSYSNDTLYKWYAYYYSPRYLTRNMTGSAALCAILSDAAFGTAVHDKNVAVPNPGKELSNPNPDTLRVGDIIKYYINEKDYHVSMVIGKNADQILLVGSNRKETVDWEAWIPKTTKIEVAFSRYQTAAPSPTPKASTTPTASPKVTASTVPSASPSATPNGVVMSAEEQYASGLIMTMKDTLKHGMQWTDNSKYPWYAFNGRTDNLGGSAALAAILSDAAFADRGNAGVSPNYPARQVNRPASSTLRVGDIINISNHYSIIISRDDKVFVLAEANRANSGVVEWGRTIPITTSVDYIWTRWPA